MTTETRKRREYTEDFKRDAVALVTDQGYKVTAAALVREYVAVYYNSLRLHSTLGYKTPMDYEKDLGKVSGIT